MQANRDILLFIGLFIGVFVIWVATGGPQQARESNGSLFGATSSPFSTGITIGPGDSRQPQQSRTQQPRTTEGTPQKSASPADIAAELRQARASLDDVAAEIQTLERFGVASRYADYVTLRPTRARETAASEEYVTISVAERAPNDVHISGWQLESKLTGYRTTIGNGTTLPEHGSVNRTSPVTLSAGQRALVISGPSPLGTSFQENRCTGYFEQFQAFTPDLDRRCPDPETVFTETAPAAIQKEGEDTDNDGESNCREYVNRLNRCRMPTQDLDRVTPSLSSACRSFIQETYTYSGCVARERSNPAFYSDTWRIYLNSTQELWDNDREVLRLIDSTGRTVDVATY
jgi:hypothetical protein